MSSLQDLLLCVPSTLGSELIIRVLQDSHVQAILEPLSRDELLAIFSALFISVEMYSTPLGAILLKATNKQCLELHHLALSVTPKHAQCWRQVCSWVDVQGWSDPDIDRFKNSVRWLERALWTKAAAEQLDKSWGGIKVWSRSEAPMFFQQLLVLDAEQTPRFEGSDQIIWISAQEWESMGKHCPKWVSVLDTQDEMPDLFCLENSVVFIAKR